MPPGSNITNVYSSTLHVAKLQAVANRGNPVLELAE